ncbi:MAG: LamG-like jellyroll fold domain-containing protein, partial [Synechococcaceae cyanobacterium ELA182]
QRGDIQLDPASKAVLQLSSASSAVIGGYSDGINDTVVPGAWLAAPELSISSVDRPTLLHDLIARDRLTIHSDTELNLRPIAVLNLGTPNPSDSGATTLEASLELTAPSINLTHDVADLVIEAETSAPQQVLSGNLREPLTLAFTVTTPGGQSAAFSATVVAGQRNSLDELLVAINDALATAAGSAGLPLTSIPSLGLRGAYLRFQLGLFGDSPEQLAFGLKGALSSGLEQLGFIASSANRQGVIPATVFSHALATSINAGSAAQPYDHLDWGGGVRADAASEQTSLGGTLHLAASASTAITAAVDVPVLKFTADQAAKLPENPDIFADVHPTGRTRELEIDSAGSFTLTGLVNTSSAPQLELVRYRSIEGSLTLEIGALPDQRQLSSSKPIELQAATDLSIKRDAAVADGPVALELPALQATAGGHLLLGDGLQLQLKPNGSPSPVKGLLLNGASVTISGSITSSSAITTTVTASAGDLILQPGSVSRSVGFDLTGLRGDQTFTASDHLLQAMALGSTGGNSDSDSAPSISLQAGTGLISSAAITAASLQMATTSGVLRTDPQLYTTAAGDMVDLLGYRVDNQGVFVDEAGRPMSPDQAPIYAGPPAAVLSGGAIQAPDLRLDAGSGTLLLQNSITPAGVSSTTLMASAFRAADHGFALAGAVPANGTAVRFYGVQPGALSNLEDGGTYWVVRSASAPGLLQLARSASDAASGQVIVLSLAANLVGAAAVGQLLQAPQSQGSQAALRGGSIGLTQSATLQASNLTLTSAGAIDLLGEAWLLADRTSLDYSTSADLHIGRSRSDLRRALLQTEVLTLISAGGLLLDGYLDLTGSSAATLAFKRDLTISGELTAKADLTITTPGNLAINGAGSIDSDGELTIKAESVQVAAEATRAGWEKGTVITGVTPITTTDTVQAGSAMQDLHLTFDAGAVAHLQVSIPTNTLQLVGLNGEPLRHGLQDATPLYYQSSGLANGDAGGAGLINTSPSTTDPSLGTRYDVLVLDATTFQLRRQNAIVPLTAAPFLNGDALDGLVVNSREVSSTTTETRQIGTTAVVTGYSWYTYGLNLLQDAFYSPTSQKIVEAFTPGIDFQINNVIWGSAGTPAADLPWNSYTPSQRQAVLDSLGYLPFYAVDVDNVLKLTSKDGQLSSTPVANPWFNDPQVLVVPSSGALQGKAIVGPAAAFSDPYSLVSRDPGATQGLAMKTSVATAGPLSQPLNGLTLEAWVYLDPTSSSNGVILSSQLSSVDGGSATTPSFNLEVANGHLALVNDAGSVLISPSTVIGKETLAKGQWLHLAAAVTPGLGGSKGTASLFINGVEDTPTANQVTLDSSAHFQKLSISPAAATASLSGSIREVKVWGQTRTAAQVVEDMTQPPYGDLTAIAYWFPLDGSAESGIPDRPAATLASGATYIDTKGINAPDAQGSWQEAVGDSIFNASVLYNQIAAALKSTSLTQTVQNPSDPTKTLSLKADVVSTNQNGPLYQVSYNGNGLESITLERNRTVQNAGSFSTNTPISLTGDQQRKPYWADNSTQSISSYDASNSQVYGVGSGLAPFLQGGTSTPVLAPPGQAYTLSLTAAGGLALYGPDGTILWQATDASGKPVQGGVQALMQPDGNFVLYKTMQPLDGNGRSDAAIWSTGTITSGARLILTSQGGLQILNASSQVIKTLYTAQQSALVLGSGATLLPNKGSFSELLNKGYPVGLPTSTLSTAPTTLSNWQTANVSYPSTGPQIVINSGNASVKMLGDYGAVLASTWENPQADGLTTHLDPSLNGSRLSFTFNRLDRWTASSEIRLYYVPDGTTTPVLISNKALPSANAMGVNLAHSEFQVAGNKGFIDLIPRPFFGELYGDPNSSDNANEQSFDVQVTLGAGIPAGNLVIASGPSIRADLYPQFAVNNIALALPSQPASLQASSSADIKLDYISSTASLTGGTLSGGNIKEVGSIASPNPVDSNWAATPSPAWQYVQGQSPSASVFADVGSTRYQAVLGGIYLWLSSSTDGGLNWGGWIMLPAGMTSSSPPALASINGTLYLAYVGQDIDKKINITKYNSTSKSWENLYQIPNQGAKTICMLAEGSNLAVYYQGLNDQIYRTSTSNPDSSSSWQLNLVQYNNGTANQTSSGQLAVASLDGTTYLGYQGGTSSTISNTIYLTKSNQQATSSSWEITNGVPQPNTSNHAGVALARNQSNLVIGYADQDATGSVIFSLNQSSNGGSTWNPFATLKSVSGTQLVSPSGTTTFSLLGLAGSTEPRLLTSTITNNNALNIWNAAFDSPKDIDLTVTTGNGTGYNFFSMPSYGSDFFATPQYNQTTTWPAWGPSRTLQEIWNSYNYNWQSIPFENTDQRQNLSFSATSRPVEITTLEPVYQQYDITTTRTSAQLDPSQTLRPVYVSETRNSGVQVQTQSVDIRGAAVRFDSLRGRSVNITTASSSQFAGNLTASADGKVTISSDGSLGFSATRPPAPVDPSTPISTIAAAEIQLNAANGLTLGSGLLLAGNGDQPNRSIVLAAGSASLQSEALIAPTTKLSLSGTDLSLPLGGTRPLQAQSINLDFGSLLNLQASQANAMASPLLLELGNAPTGVENGIRLSQPDPTGSLRIQHLQTTLPVTVDDAGTLDLAGTISGTILDLEAENLLLSTATSLEASESLILNQQGDSLLSSNNLIVAAPSLVLSSSGDLDLQVNTADLKVSGARAVKIQNLSTNRSRLAVSGAGTQQFSVRSELVLDGLNTGSGDVTIVVASGDLWLGAVQQSSAGSLTLTATNGQIGNLEQVPQERRQLGALWVYAAADINLDLRELQRLNATSETGTIRFRVVGDPADLITVESLRAPSGDVNFDGGLAAVSLPEPEQIQAVRLGLSTSQGLLINTQQPSILKAREQIVLALNDLQIDPNQLSLETTNLEGSVQIYFSQLALADALPTLPLFSTGKVLLSGVGGLRLTDKSFNDRQLQSPLDNLLFAADFFSRSTLGAEASINNSTIQSRGFNIPKYWPYGLVHVTQLLEDENGVPYVLRPATDDSDTPSPHTHYLPDNLQAPGFPYRYEALLTPQASIQSTTNNLIVQFRSDQKLLSLDNLNQATLWGISASDIDATTIQPILMSRNGVSSKLHAVQTAGTPQATALLSFGEKSKASALKDSAIRRLKPTTELSQLIEQPSTIIVGHADPSLDLARVAPFASVGISKSQMPSAVVSSSGAFRLALSSAPNPDDLLGLETKLNGVPLLLLATAEAASFSEHNTLE